jgi:hypothetical protein
MSEKFFPLVTFMQHPHHCRNLEAEILVLIVQLRAMNRVFSNLGDWQPAAAQGRLSSGDQLGLRFSAVFVHFVCKLDGLAAGGFSGPALVRMPVYCVLPRARLMPAASPLLFYAFSAGCTSAGTEFLAEMIRRGSGRAILPLPASPLRASFAV